MGILDALRRRDSIPMVFDGDEEERDQVQRALVEAIREAVPDGQTVIIGQLNVHINYACGGGAKILINSTEVENEIRVQNPGDIDSDSFRRTVKRLR
jgi:hypothetical protein